MLKVSLIYFVIWFLLQFLEVNCQMTPFKPSVIGGHTATFIDNKLYILGGFNVNNAIVNEFFYLDVSVPFNTRGLSWQDLTNINTVPPHVVAASDKGANNYTLFLFGANTINLVYEFNS